MSSIDDVVYELRSQAAQGKSAVQIATWLNHELGEDVNFFSFAHRLFLAFKIPVGAIHRAEEWSGFGRGGKLSDDELTQLLGPLIPRSTYPGE